MHRQPGIVIAFQKANGISQPYARNAQKGLKEFQVLSRDMNYQK